MNRAAGLRASGIHGIGPGAAGHHGSQRQPEAVVETDQGSFVDPPPAGPRARSTWPLPEDREGGRLRRHHVPPHHRRRDRPGRRPAFEGPEAAGGYGTRRAGPAEGRVLGAALRARRRRRGAPALATRTAAATSSSSCLADQPSLNGPYTIFGEVVEGMEVADKIGETPVEGDKREAPRRDEGASFA